jgi:protease I
MPKRIAVLVTDNYDDLEYSQPVAAFLAAKHQVSNIATQGGVIVHSRQRHSSTQIDHSIADITIDDFDALFIPGGKSALTLADHPQVLSFIQAFNQAKKSIFSICDGSLLLSEANILQDRIITSLRQHATRFEKAGAIYYDAELVNDNNQLISSRKNEDLPVFIHECLNVLRH